MKTRLITSLLLVVIVSLASGQRYRGNPIVNLVQKQGNDRFFLDPIDDTVSYRQISGKVYRDANGKVYVLAQAVGPSSDSLIVHEHFIDYSHFFKLKTYRAINKDYFVNNGKVYAWLPTSDSMVPVEIEKADPKTFKPFEMVCGGVDKRYVFYGDPREDIKIVKGADPRTVIVLNPEADCRNCYTGYFKDDRHVYYQWEMIDADLKTFRLSDEDSFDAVDQYGKFKNGKRL